MRNVFDHAKQRWSLRKLSVGVCSVLLGMTVMGGTAALADSTPSGSSTTPVTFQASSAAVQPAPADNQSSEDYQNVVVPTGYANALNGFRPGQTQSQALANASQEGRAANTNNPNEDISQVTFGTNLDGSNFVNFNIRYQHNPADEQETVDPQHLTASQEADLTAFAAGTINHIRQQVQAQPNGNRVSVGYLRTSPYATQLGNELVHAAYDDFTGSGHNENGLLTAALRRGVITGDIRNNFIGENIGDVGNGLLVVRLRNRGAISNITMDMLKEDVYTNIVSMMYQDYNDGQHNGLVGAGGHTTALLNDPQYNSHTLQGGNAVGLDSNGNAMGNQYFALTIDRRNQVHFNFIPDATATDAVRKQLANNAVVLGLASNSSAGSSATSSTTSSAAGSSHSSTPSSSTSSANGSAQSSAAGSSHSSAASNASSSSAQSSSNSSSSAASSVASSSTNSSTESNASSSAATSSASSSAHSSNASNATSSSATSSATSSAQSSSNSSAANSSTASSSTGSSASTSTQSSASSSASSSSTSSTTSNAASSANSNAQSSTASNATSSSASSSQSSSAESTATSSATSTSSQSSNASSTSSSAQSSAQSSADSSTTDSVSSSDNNSAASNATHSTASNVASTADSSAANSNQSADMNDLVSDAHAQQQGVDNASDAQLNGSQSENKQVQLNATAAQTNAPAATSSQKKLPQTGNSLARSVALAGLGLVAFAMTIGLAAKRHDKTSKIIYQVR